MWWLLPTALAGKLVPPVLPVRCEPDVARDHARAHLEADGLLAGAVALEVAESPFCCTAMRVTGVDSTGLRVGGSVALGVDCTLLGVSSGVPAERATSGVAPIGASPVTSAASILRPAYEALRTRADATDDLLVAVRVRRGWHVWLLRPNDVDVLTVSRAELDRDGALVRIVDEVRAWTPPPEAEAARTVWSFASP